MRTLGKLRQRHAKQPPVLAADPALPARTGPTIGFMELSIPAILLVARPLQAGLVNVVFDPHNLLNAALAMSHGSFWCLRLSLVVKLIAGLQE